MAELILAQIAPDPIEILSALGKIGRWLQAIGIVVLAWLAFHVVSFFLNRKKLRKIETLEESLKRIENKIDKISKN